MRSWQWPPTFTFEMKGFLVVDRLNDIHFLDTDKEFARHINEQARSSGLCGVCSINVLIVTQNTVTDSVCNW